MSLTTIFFCIAVLCGVICLWYVKGYSGNAGICKVLAGIGIVLTLSSEYLFLLNGMADLSMPFEGWSYSFTGMTTLFTIVLPLLVYIFYYFHPSWYRPVAIGCFGLLLYLVVTPYLIWSFNYWGGGMEALLKGMIDAIQSPRLWSVIAEFALCIPLVVEQKHRSEREKAVSV